MNITFNSDLTKIVKRLEQHLQPGKPVILRETSTTTLPLMPRSMSSRDLFLSNGEITSEGKLGIQEGKRNRIFALVRTNSYSLIKDWGDAYDRMKIDMPRTNRLSHFNEGTFSPAGPTRWTSYHSRGTREIRYGRLVADEYQHAIRAIKFAQDSFHFKLDNVYAQPNSSVICIGDDRDGVRKQERSKRTSEVACINAVRLLLRATGETNDLQITQLGWYRGGAKHYEQFHANPYDFVFRESSHPSRSLALVKIGEGNNFGDIYIMPLKEEFVPIIEKAISPENVRKYFPAGK